MGIVEAVVLGLVQGITEFLPISSSGHLLLVPALVGWKDPGAGFTAVMQLGSIMAVFIYFAKDLKESLSVWVRSFFDPGLRSEPGVRLAWAVVVGTVPIVLLGLAFNKFIETALRTSLIVTIALIVVSFLMLFAENASEQDRDMAKIKVKDGLLVGLFQALALVPGVSRSGSTISGGLLLGLDRASAARFSFLLSVPSILAAGLYQLVKSRSELLNEGLAPTFVATFVAFVSGYWAISFLVRFLQTRTMVPFIIYRLALAGVIIVLSLTDRIAS